jgi:hypothetical protein
VPMSESPTPGQFEAAREYIRSLRRSPLEMDTREYVWSRPAVPGDEERLSYVLPAVVFARLRSEGPYPWRFATRRAADVAAIAATAEAIAAGELMP